MTTTTPKIEERSAQHYVGIRIVMPTSDLPTVIPQLTDEVFEWLKKHDTAPTGPCIIRYHVIDMPQKLDVEMGWIIDRPVDGDQRVTPGVIPAGRYGSVTYTGDYSGLYDANSVLVGWANDNGIEWDRWDDPNGDAFRSRVEFYITDPAEEPDPSKWVTEVAIKLAEV